MASTHAFADKSRILPRTFIRGLAVLVLATLVFVAYATLTDRPLVAQVPASPVADERAVYLNSQLAAGKVVVTDSEGQLIADLGQDGGGFVTTIHRVVLRERATHGVAADGPILIRAFENGRLGVHDPSTGFDADLMAFGSDNIGVFAELLTITATDTNGGRTDGITN
ncbi:MAG: photosynthetic complex assembly protein PuhC [Pseudomonadota bacterium]